MQTIKISSLVSGFILMISISIVSDSHAYDLIQDYHLDSESGIAINVFDNLILFEDLSWSDLYFPLKTLAYGVTLRSLLSILFLKAGLRLSASPRTYFTNFILIVYTGMFFDTYVTKLYYELKIYFSFISIDSLTALSVFLVSILSRQQMLIDQEEQQNIGQFLQSAIHPNLLMSTIALHYFSYYLNRDTHSSNYYYKKSQRVELSGGIANYFQINAFDMVEVMRYEIKRLHIGQATNKTESSLDTYGLLSSIMDKYDIQSLDVIATPLLPNTLKHRQTSTEGIQLIILFNSNSSTTTNHKKFLRKKIHSPGLNISSLFITSFFKNRPSGNFTRSILEPDIINSISGLLEAYFDTESKVKTTFSEEYIDEPSVRKEHSTFGKSIISFSNENTEVTLIWDYFDQDTFYLNTPCQDQTSCINHQYRVPGFLGKLGISFSAGLLYKYGNELNNYILSQLPSNIKYTFHEQLTEPEDTDECPICFNTDKLTSLPCRHPICTNCLNHMIQTSHANNVRRQSSLLNLISLNIKCHMCRRVIPITGLN